MADKTKGAATNMEVTFANLQHGKRLKGKTRSRLHILVGLLFLGAVAGVAALIAKKGLPDIDPVKVRARSGIGPTACRAYTLVPTPRAPRRSVQHVIVQLSAEPAAETRARAQEEQL